MILFRNRLVFGLIWKIIKVFFTVAYSILSFFGLQFTLLLGLIGVVLYFTGTLDANRAVLVIYTLLLVLSVVYAVMSTIKKLLGLDKKVKRSKGMQIVDKPKDQPVEQPQYQQQPVAPQYQPPLPSAQTPIVASEVPRYFRVKQNPSFVMAEYSNRYELFRVENGQLVKIRTDYK